MIVQVCCERRTYVLLFLKIVKILCKRAWNILKTEYNKDKNVTGFKPEKAIVSIIDLLAFIQPNLSPGREYILDKDEVEKKKVV